MQHNFHESIDKTLDELFDENQFDYSDEAKMCLCFQHIYGLC